MLAAGRFDEEYKVREKAFAAAAARLQLVQADEHQ